jgi:hypothetical protein
MACCREGAKPPRRVTRSRRSSLTGPRLAPAAVAAKPPTAGARAAAQDDVASANALPSRPGKVDRAGTADRADRAGTADTGGRIRSRNRNGAHDDSRRDRDGRTRNRNRGDDRNVGGDACSCRPPDKILEEQSPSSWTLLLGDAHRTALGDAHRGRNGLIDRRCPSGRHVHRGAGVHIVA